VSVVVGAQLRIEDVMAAFPYRDTFAAVSASCVIGIDSCAIAWHRGVQIAAVGRRLPTRARRRTRRCGRRHCARARRAVRVVSRRAAVRVCAIPAHRGACGCGGVLRATVIVCVVVPGVRSCHH
jgi:hypothetical protein